jgi:hypothetical protein
MKNFFGKKLLFLCFLLLAFSWLYWVTFSLREAKPGLLDDGSHITGAAQFAASGFIRGLYGSFEAFFKGEIRFYITHLTLMGLYYTWFGENLTLWYAANIAISVLSGLAVGYVIFSFTKNLWFSSLGAILLLTSSPAAEALRGNFGKAEAVMVALIAFGLAFWTHSIKSRWPKLFLSLAGTFFVLGCLSKESGKVIGIAMTLPWIVFWITSWITRKPLEEVKGEVSTPLRNLFLMGATGIAASYIVAIPSRNLEWMKGYYRLNFNWAHITEKAQFYLRESPDFLVLLALFTLVYLLSFLIHRKLDNKFFLAGACLAGTWGYLLSLLLFPISNVYYLFVPSGLLAIAAGLVISLIPDHRKLFISAAFTIFFLTRFYSIPYLFMLTTVQQLFDRINHNAMLYARSENPTAIYALDISEDSQLIQEWNLLSVVYKNTKGIPPLYGANPDFMMWRYQDRIRNDPKAPEDSYYNELARGKPREWREQFPKVGEYATCRFGRIVVPDHFLRATMPFKQKTDSFLALFDKNALTKIKDISEKISIYNPSELKKSKITYGWSFYKVSSPLGFLMQDYTLDQWMTKTTSLQIPENSPYSNLTVKLDAPHGHSFPIRVWAELDGKEIASADVPSAGSTTLTIPVDKSQRITIHSSSWFQPAKLGISADTRELSLRLMQVEAK